jgi:hypothetical protein
MILQENEQEIIETILQLTYKIELDRLLKEDLKSAIEHSDTIPVSMVIKNIFFEIACLYDVFEDDCRSCRDLHPELSIDNKKDILRTALSDLLMSQYKDHPILYAHCIDHIYFGGDKIEVTEICREDWGYIIFKAVGNNDYYLDLMMNKSSAYWSETRKIDEAAAESLIADPSVENGRSIFYKYGA